MLKTTKDRFRSEKRVNKIMLGKIDEVTKEIEIILRQFLIDQRYGVILTLNRESNHVTHLFWKFMKPFLMHKNINLLRRPF